MSKGNNKDNKFIVKLMAGILAGLMIFSLAITPIAYFVSYLTTK